MTIGLAMLSRKNDGNCKWFYTNFCRKNIETIVLNSIKSDAVLHAISIKKVQKHLEICTGFATDNAFLVTKI